jgi:hypothetical protein
MVYVILVETFVEIGTHEIRAAWGQQWENVEKVRTMAVV